MNRRVLAVVAVVLACMAGTVQSSSAATSSRSDPRGDAPAYLDITRLTVNNTARNVVFRVKVRDLRKRGVFRLWMYDGDAGAEAHVQRRANGSVKAKVFNTDLDDTYVVDCPGLRASWKIRRDLVRVSVPQSCYTVYATPPRWDVGVKSVKAPGDVSQRDAGPKFSVARG